MNLFLGAIYYYHNKQIINLFSKTEIMYQYHSILDINIINKTKHCHLENAFKKKCI